MVKITSYTDGYLLTRLVTGRASAIAISKSTYNIRIIVVRTIARLRDSGLWEIYAYKRHAYGMVSIRSMPIRDAPIR
jgi:hypothetical protein